MCFIKLWSLYVSVQCTFSRMLSCDILKPVQFPLVDIELTAPAMMLLKLVYFQ